MVSQRCILKVKEELENLLIPYTKISLGYVDLPGSVSKELSNILQIKLSRSGLEILDSKKDILIERIKTSVNKMIKDSENKPEKNYSKILSEELNQNYTYLSNVFSKHEGQSIQQFIIQNKIDKVKQLLMYGELTLSEISYMLHYSSVAHLSNQFKKVTGASPSLFKIIEKRRISMH